jgi:hypothetical protein
MKHTSKSKSLFQLSRKICLIDQEVRSAAFLGANVKNFLKKGWRKNKNGISEAAEIQA